jgi:hypothetical protein
MKKRERETQEVNRGEEERRKADGGMAGVT